MKRSSGLLFLYLPRVPKTLLTGMPIIKTKAIEKLSRMTKQDFHNLSNASQLKTAIKIKFEKQRVEKSTRMGNCFQCFKESGNCPWTEFKRDNLNSKYNLYWGILLISTPTCIVKSEVRLLEQVLGQNILPAGYSKNLLHHKHSNEMK